MQSNHRAVMYFPRIYLYKITFEEVPYYYYGIHKEKLFNEYYMGSPVTHKWMWYFYTPKKQILQIFDYTDDGWTKAQEIEKRLIKPFYNDDKWCLNEHCGGYISLKICRENGKNVFKNKKGCFSLNQEERHKVAKISGINAHKNKIGIHSLTDEEKQKARSKGGKTNFKNKTGIFAIEKEVYIENCRRGGKTQGNLHKQNKTGFFTLSFEELSSAGKKGGKIAAQKINNQKWKCLVTGHISTPGPLTRYQIKRGIDVSKRVKIDD